MPKGGDKWNADYSERTLTNVNLFDVSVVTSPAYGGNATNVDARSAQYVVTQDWRSKHNAALAKLNAIVAADKAAALADSDEAERVIQIWLDED